MLDWEKIVGDQFAKICQAVRMSFPKGQRTQGALYLKTSSAMATHITFLQPEILDKVNRYYGYQAIVRLVIIQGQIDVKSDVDHSIALPDLTLEQSREIHESVGTLSHAKLQNALCSFGERFYQRKAYDAQ